MGNNFEIMLTPEKFGYIQCPHCNGYGSSLKDPEGVNTKHTILPVQHRSFHFGPRLAIDMVQNLLKQYSLQFFQTGTVKGFSPRRSIWKR